MTARLSVVIPTLNVEENIRDCLESVRWADEIIVLVMGSTDRTLEICKPYAHGVYCRKHEHPIIGIQRNVNLGIEKATGDWIMRLDADERVPHELRDEIRRVINSDTPYDVYAVRFKQYLAGYWLPHGFWTDAWLPRLFRKGAARYACRALVHEPLEIDGEIGRLHHAVIHFSHPTLAVMVEKFNLYTTQEARTKLRMGKKFRLRQFGQPLRMFWQCYVVKRGYKDGVPGLIAAIMWAFYVFLSFAKLWELQHGRPGATKENTW